VHAGSDKPGDTHHLVDLDRDGAHAVGYSRRQAAAGANRSQAALEDRLALIKVGDDAAADGCFRFQDGSLGSRAGDVNCGQIGSGENRAQLDVSSGGNHAGALLLAGPQPVSYDAKHQVRASACDDESEE